MSETKTFEQALSEFNKTLSVHGLEIQQKEELQRSDQWFADRCGIFTASKFKDLMTCESRAKGRDFSTHHWIFNLGDTAFAYILEKAIERATGEVLNTPKTWQMRWGTDHEPIGKEFAMDKYKSKIKEFGFVKFLANAGASTDGEIKIAGIDLNYELKCPATVMSHYNLKNGIFDESHTYFWQVTGQMLAQKRQHTLFNTFDPRYPHSAKLGEKQVELSPVHAFALEMRLIIAEKILTRIVDSDFTANFKTELSIIKESCPADQEGMKLWHAENIEPLRIL